MKIRSLMLTPTFAKNVKVPGRYGDGRGVLGLSLLVRPASRGGFTKSWTQYVRIGGKPTSLGLDRYPVVTLAKARQRALDNARVIADGRDPRGGSPRDVPTFAQALETVIAIHAENWKDRSGSEHQWRATLTTYAFPRIGAKPVDKVATADVMPILTPIWSSKHVTAKRIRQRIGAVMRWAVAQGHRPDDPAGDALGAALPKSGAAPKHQRELPHAEVGAALRRIRRADTHFGTRVAFEFLVLTAAGSGEVRGARWQVIDREGAVWTIPGTRMKAGHEKRVPLTVLLKSSTRPPSPPARTASCFRRRPGACCTRRPWPGSRGSWRSTPCRTASGRASGTGRRNARTRRARCAKSRSPTSAPTASRRPTGAPTCSMAAAG